MIKRLFNVLFVCAFLWLLFIFYAVEVSDSGSWWGYGWVWNLDIYNLEEFGIRILEIGPLTLVATLAYIVGCYREG